MVQAPGPDGWDPNFIVALSPKSTLCARELSEMEVPYMGTFAILAEPKVPQPTPKAAGISAGTIAFGIAATLVGLGLWAYFKS